MLEGMAPSQSEAVRAVAGDLLLYAPIVATTATSPPRSRTSCAASTRTPHRELPRRICSTSRPTRRRSMTASRAVRRIGAATHSVDATRRRTASAARAHRAHAGSRTAVRQRARHRLDASRQPALDHRPPLAEPTRSLRDRPAAPTTADVDAAVQPRRRTPWTWWELGRRERASRDHATESATSSKRIAAEILATMVADADKTVAEGDPEVSEAIDFARYYAARALGLDDDRRVPRPAAARHGRRRATVELPVRHPRRGSARRARRRQLASSSSRRRNRCDRCAHRRAVLGGRHRPPTSSSSSRPTTTTSAAGSSPIPTSTRWCSPARRPPRRCSSGWRPDLRLHAETSGKNAMVITAYRRHRPRGGRSRPVGVRPRRPEVLGGQPGDRRGAPLRRPGVPRTCPRRRRDPAGRARRPTSPPTSDRSSSRPDEALSAALTSLDPGESWLLRARGSLRRTSGSGAPASASACVPDRGSPAPSASGPCSASSAPTTSTTRSQIQNDSEFGLTAGLQSLDPDEIARWLERVEAGNLYVNRGITGAIVRRQPFGGWKRSGVGPTAKAGGPNYVDTLARWHDTGVDIDTVTAAYQRWMSDIGHREHDPSGLAAERNVHRYRALSGRCVGPMRIERDATATASWWRPRRARPARAPSGPMPPASPRPCCAHDSERSASTGSDSSATTRRHRRATTSALLRMPPACRSTTRHPSVLPRSSYRGGCASSL